jgi:hypothetical protein
MPTIAADGIYYIDLGPDYQFSTGSFVSIYPEQLQFDDVIRGVGNCSWQISFSAKDQDGNTVVSGHDIFGPYRTYYRLRYGNITIQAGPLVSWTTELGTDYMSCAGKTWEHLLERWEYPFDGDPAHVNDYVFANSFIGDEVTGSGAATPAGLTYQANNRDVNRIINDLLSTSMLIGNRAVVFDLSPLGALSGIKTNYQFTLGDNVKMFSVVDSLASIGQGMDWWISWDLKFYWATPFRFGDNTSPVIIYTFDSDHMPDKLKFTNNGPDDTHIMGRGAGLATSTTLSRSYGYLGAQIVYGRLDGSYDFGDVRNIDELNKITKKQLSLDVNPQHEIPLSIDPSRITDFWSEFRKGRAIFINMEMIAHQIDSAQQMKSYSCTVDNNGNAMVDYTLQQIYDVSYSIGTEES